MARLSHEGASVIIGDVSVSLSRPTNDLNFKKTLFQSPAPATPSGASKSGSSSDIMKSLIYKVQLEQEFDTNLFYIKRDMHDQRLKDLRELANSLQDDAWQYEPAEKLVGLQWIVVECFFSSYKQYCFFVSFKNWFMKFMFDIITDELNDMCVYFMKVDTMKYRLS